jgi:hypothetical protein
VPRLDDDDPLSPKRNEELCIIYINLILSQPPASQNQGPATADDINADSKSDHESRWSSAVTYNTHSEPNSDNASNIEQCTSDVEVHVTVGFHRFMAYHNFVINNSYTIFMRK